MIEKLKQYSEAWAGFVEWMDKNYDGITDMPIYDELTLRLFRDFAIEWLDSRGIYISTAPTLGGFWWLINQKQNREEQLFKEGYVSRSEATEAGIIKAFEIVNQRGKK